MATTCRPYVYIPLAHALMPSILQFSAPQFTRRGIAFAIAMSIASAIISTLILKYFSGAVGESAIWIPAGISLGLLLVLGVQYWPFLFVGITLGEMGGGHDLLMGAQLAFGSLLGCFTTLWILTRFSKFNLRLQSPSDFGLLILGSLIGATVSTSLNIEFMIWNDLLESSRASNVYIKWFTGDFFGFAFITPIILILYQPWDQSWDRRKYIFFALFFSVAFLFNQVIFLGWFKELIDVSDRGFMAFLLMACFAYFFGLRGAMIYFLALILQTMFGAYYGDAFFDQQLLAHPGPMYLWVYLSVLGLVGLMASIIVENFNRKNQNLWEATKVILKSEERLREIVGNTPLLMATYNFATEITDYVNPQFTSSLGYLQSDFAKPNSWWSVAYPDASYRAEVEKEWGRRAKEVQETGAPFAAFETRTSCKDGSVRLISWGCFSVSDRMVIYGVDVTDQKRSEELLKVTSAVYRAMGDAVVICNVMNHILIANDAFKELTGFQDDELVGSSFSDLLVKGRGTRSYSDIFTALAAVGRWEGQIYIRMKNGKEALRFLSIYSTFDQEGRPLQRVTLISEVTNQRKARELVNQQANFDPLTDLPNRRLMLDRLDQMIKQSARAQTKLAVIYIDLDKFKDINDSRGHDFGDALLKSVAQRLHEEIRDVDTVSRIGGDEFVILLGQLERPEQADPIVRQILKKLVEPVLIKGQMIYTTASLGVSIYPTDGGDGKTLLLSADQAMYAAKEKGRNGYQYFTTELQLKASYRAGIISELREAITKKQFQLEFQPIIDLSTGEIHHAEALLRWHRSTGDVVMPAAFIDIAEESGLIVEIGDWVLQEVLAFLKALGSHHNLMIAINVSAAQFNSSKHTSKDWIEWILESGISPERIVLEITERMMLIQTHRVLRKIAVLQEAGCKFSVDDFGTGYSSLASLKNFNFDYLKIDSHFVNSLAPDSMDASLVAAMISMARGLGLESVAEGVETDEQAKLLKEMGCQFAQGYLYSKPISAEAFRKILS